MVLISIYLIINGVDHLFTYLLAIPVIIFLKEMSVFNSVIFVLFAFMCGWSCFYLFVGNRTLLCSPGQPGAPCVDGAGLFLPSTRIKCVCHHSQ